MYVIKSDLIVLLSKSKTAFEDAKFILKNKLKEDLSLAEDKQLDRLIKTLRGNIQKRYSKLRSRSAFITKHSDWLKTEFKIPRNLWPGPNIEANNLAEVPSVNLTEHTSDNLPRVPSTSGPIRRTSGFYRRIETAAQNLGDNLDADGIIKAAEKALKRKGSPKSEKLSKAVRKLSTSKDTAKLTDSKNESIFTPEEGFNLMVQLSLSADKYIVLRKLLKNKGYQKLIPSYKAILKIKNECRPSRDNIQVSESGASTSLEALTKHTLQRILEYRKSFFENNKENMNNAQIKLDIAWGMDGSGDHSQYKQKFDSEQSNDSNLFAITIIPLRLKAADGTIIWQNPRPQSVYFCRPIKLLFEKETRELVLKERDDILKQINELDTFQENIGNITVKVNCDFHFTMIDGKILTYITGNKSFQNCPICKASPTQIKDVYNNINTPTFEAVESNLKHGASPLHCYIRFLECVLHIGYRINFKTWKQDTPEKKEEVSRRKKHIQLRAYKEMGLRLDYVKAGSSGNSNDGNTARRAFHAAEKFSEIVGVDLELILRFKKILVALNCQLTLNPEKFGVYCRETAYMYHFLYGWYNMPSSVHKILIHGGEIVKNSTLPVGMLGEEGAEARNKFYRLYRQHHARKYSRVYNLKDVFLKCLDTSDPLLSSQRIEACPPKIKQSALEIKEFLEIQDIEQEEIDVAQEISSAEDYADEIDYEHNVEDQEDDLFDISLINILNE